MNQDDKSAGAINPKWGNDLDYADYSSEVNFDIAISASEGKSIQGKGGIKVLSLEVGGGSENNTRTSTVSRINFQLPVAFPAVTVIDVPARRKLDN